MGQLKGMLIQTDIDVDKASDLIQALPQDRKGIAKVAKKVMRRVTLESDEMRAMIDSGSFAHAVDAEQEESLKGI